MPAFATCDHKPTTAAEKARIKKAGGMVRFKRVNGAEGLGGLVTATDPPNPSRIFV